MHGVLDRIEEDRAVELRDVDDALHAEDVLPVPVKEHPEPDPEHGPVDGLVGLDAERGDVSGVVVVRRGGRSRQAGAAGDPPAVVRPRPRGGAGGGFGTFARGIGPGCRGLPRVPPPPVRRRAEPALRFGLPGVRAVDVLDEQGDRVGGRLLTVVDVDAGAGTGVRAPVRVRALLSVPVGGAVGEADRGRGVHRLEPCPEAGGPLGSREVRLGEDQPIRQGHLLHRLRVAVELHRAVERVHHRHHRSGAVVVAEHRVGGQGVDDGGRVREPRRLDHHPVVARRLAPLPPPVEIEEGASEVVPHRAAHAPVVEEHHAPGHRLEQVVVEADLAELVHEHRRRGEAGRGEEAAEKGGLAAPEEAGHHVDREEGAPVGGPHLARSSRTRCARCS